MTEHSHPRLKLALYGLAVLLGASFAALGVAKSAYGAVIVGLGVVIAAGIPMRSNWHAANEDRAPAARHPRPGQLRRRH